MQLSFFSCFSFSSASPLGEIASVASRSVFGSETGKLALTNHFQYILSLYFILFSILYSLYSVFYPSIPSVNGTTELEIPQWPDQLPETPPFPLSVLDWLSSTSIPCIR